MLIFSRKIKYAYYKLAVQDAQGRKRRLMKCQKKMTTEKLIQYLKTRMKERVCCKIARRKITCI